MNQKIKKGAALLIVFQENTIFDVLNLHFEVVLTIGIMLILRKSSVRCNNLIKMSLCICPFYEHL